MTSDQFKSTRDKLGLTRQQLAIQMGFTVRAIGHWETGARSIPPSVGILIQLLLEKHYDRMLSGQHGGKG